jgi:hypothetical protein
MVKAPAAPNLKWSSRGRRWEVRVPDLAEANQEKGTKSGFEGKYLRILRSDSQPCMLSAS